MPGLARITNMTTEQQIRPGQIWRRKKTGKHIRIERERRSSHNIETDDGVWVGHDYKGRGVSYGSYIRRDCELISDPDETVIVVSQALEEGKAALEWFNKIDSTGLGLSGAEIAARDALRKLIPLVEGAR